MTIPIPGWATYLRVSDEDKQTPERSFAMQRQRIQEQLLASSNAPLYREYTDLLSGTNPNRKDYQQLLADAEAGRFSHIGLYRADRFGRDTIEGLQAATKLISMGVKIRIANMPGLQPENPDGFFMFLLQMGLAQREVDVLAQRTADGMEAKLRAGGWAHKAPDGYLNKERQVSSNKYERWVEIDPSYQPVLEDAWELLLTGRYTLREICEELNTRGYTRVNGRLWAWNDPKTGKRKTAFTLLHKLFHNPFYAGWVTSERFGIKMGEVRGTWDPVVSTEQFHRGVQTLRVHDKEKSRVKKHIYLLRGLLWVRAGGKCLKMYGSTPTGKYKSYSYYITHAKINGEKLHIPCRVVDAQVQDWLGGISVQPDLVPKIKEVYTREIQQISDSDWESRLTELKRQITLLKEEETRLGRLYITGKITEEAYEKLHAEWQEKLRVNELNLAELEREARIHVSDLDLALALMSKMADLYVRLDTKQQGTLLQILAKKIIINGEGKIVDYILNPPFVYLHTLANRGDEKGSMWTVEEFLAGLQFAQRGKMVELSV